MKLPKYTALIGKAGKAELAKLYANYQIDDTGAYEVQKPALVEFKRLFLIGTLAASKISRRMKR